MRYIEVKYNNSWYPAGKIIANFTNDGLSEFKNIDNQCQSGEALFNVIDTGLSVGFAAQTTTIGTTFIDWGDDVIESFNTSAYTTQTTANSLTAQVSHTYDPSNSSGKGIWVESLGAYSYTVRIYNSSSAIKYLKCARLSNIYSAQNSGVVWAEINIPTLVDISQMFSNGIAINTLRSPFLTKINIYSAINIVRSDYFAYQCQRLRMYNFPSMPNSLSRTYSLYQTGLSNSIITTDYSGVSTSSMTYYLTNSNSLRITRFVSSSWGSTSSIYGIFNDCTSLTECFLPPSIGNDKLTDCTDVFKNTPIKTITNLEYLGSRTNNTTMNGTFDSIEHYSGTLPIYAKLTKFSAKGTSSIPNKISSIRFYNTSSPWNGTSPQCDISYSGLSGSAVNQVFNDLVATGNFSGKTVKVTGLSGYTPSIITNAGGIVAT